MCYISSTDEEGEEENNIRSCWGGLIGVISEEYDCRDMEVEARRVGRFRELVDGIGFGVKWQCFERLSCQWYSRMGFRGLPLFLSLIDFAQLMHWRS